MNAIHRLPLCSGCQLRDRLIATLRQRIADLQQQVQSLQQQLREARRSRRRQACPFRRRQRVAQPHRPGRKPGHPRASRSVPTHVDTVYDVPLPDCPVCHGPLLNRTTHVQYQTDLPVVRPLVTQFNLEAGFCPRCRRHVQARHPGQLSDAVGAAANQIGPQALALAADLKHRLGVPFRKIQDLYATYFHFTVSHATLVRGCARLARLAEPTYAKLRQRLRQQRVVGIDETGWRVGGASAWLWVFTSGPTTVYEVAAHRGHEIPAQLLGVSFTGTVVCDGAGAYTALPYPKQRCLQHLLRRIADLQPTAAKRDQNDLAFLKDLLQGAIALGKQRKRWSAAAYAQEVQEYETYLDNWLQGRRRWRSPELRRLTRHLARHQPEWFRFLHEPGVPPTNAQAEQQIRPAVVSRKIGGCNKTPAGAQVHSVLASVLVTYRRLGQSFVDFLGGWWHKPPRSPPG